MGLFLSILRWSRICAFMAAEESEHSLNAVVGAIHIFFLLTVIYNSMSCEMLSYHIG